MENIKFEMVEIDLITLESNREKVKNLILEVKKLVDERVCYLNKELGERTILTNTLGNTLNNITITFYHEDKKGKYQIKDIKDKKYSKAIIKIPIEINLHHSIIPIFENIKIMLSSKLDELTKKVLIGTQKGLFGANL